VGGIRSERWATSDRNRWATYIGIRTIAADAADRGDIAAEFTEIESGKRAIARELDRREIRTARGGEWAAATVRAILRRRAA
jgi:hypothetical protein